LKKQDITMDENTEKSGQSDDPRDYMAPGEFVDSDDPGVVAFANRIIGDATTNTEKAIRLYYAVRDEIRYDPYVPWTDEDGLRASVCLERKRGFCIPKAALLAACARAAGNPARVAFADVRNHLCTPRLRKLMGTDTFTHHGIAELWLDGRWIKVTPTFNVELCNRFDVVPLEFDGHSDAMLSAYDREGRRHMEYLCYHGAFVDVPAERIKAAMIATYGHDAGSAGKGRDFAAEAEKETSRQCNF
jgi:transglutaminase-like putative cysteine protease